MKKGLIALAIMATATVGNAETFQGKKAAELLIGNTLEASYKPVSEAGSKVFYEYYDPDGSIFGLERKAERMGSYTHYIGSWKVEDGHLCSSVYGRAYSCTDYEKIDEHTYQRTVDKIKLDKVKLHKGKYRPKF